MLGGKIILYMGEPRPEDFGTTEEEVNKFNKRIKKIFKIIFFFCFMAGVTLIKYRNYDLYRSGESNYLGLLIPGVFFGFLLYIVFVTIYLVVRFAILSNGKVTGPVLSFNRAVREWKRGR